MGDLMFKPILVKKILQDNAEKRMLLVSREQSKTIYATNGHFIVAMGEIALPMIFRQAYAESIPVGKQGKWMPVEDQTGQIVRVEFTVEDQQSALQLFDEVRKRERDQMEITNQVFHPFDGEQKPERELADKRTGEITYVREDYITMLYGIAQALYPKPEVWIERIPGKVKRVSVWAAELMVAVLMPCKGPEDEKTE